MRIAFEGPIGAGKTTLAKMLSVDADFPQLLERFDENPFLEPFYSDKTRWALQMQLWFLCERHRQLTACESEDWISDYTFFKDQVFAEMLLAGSELELYRNISEELRDVAIQPDLVVMLDARDDVLLHRISLRQRSYEAAIDAEYLRTLRASYASNFHYHGRVLRIDTGLMDLSDQQTMRKTFDRIMDAARQAAM